MIPLIISIDQIERALRQKNAWQRTERVRVLETCARQLKVLLDGGKITREKYFEVNGKLLPALSEEKWRLSRSTQRTTTTPQSTPTG